jgi:hypothetical protein
MKKQPFMKSRHWKMGAFLFAGLLAIALAVQGCSSKEGEPGASGTAVQSGSSPKMSLKHLEAVSTGSMDADGVVVDIQPMEFKDEKLTVRLKANTHTGNLADYDLGELTALHFDDRKVKPSNAERLAGHHSIALLEFETGSMPETFSISIAGIRNVSERVFEWAPEKR